MNFVTKSRLNLKKNGDIKKILWFVLRLHSTAN